MSANEKLGISIEINEVTVAGDLASKISTKVQDLGKDVKPVSVGVTAGDMSGVVAELQKIANAMKSLTGETEKTASGFKATKKEVENFAKAFGFDDMDKAKKKMEELYDTKKLKQWSKEYQSELATIMKQQEAGNESARKGIEANNKAARAALNSQINSGVANIAIYKNSGLQPVNGGYVNASVNTRQSIDEAHAAALKLQNAINKIGVVKIADPFKNMFQGMAVATTTISELDGKVKLLYGDLNKLDAQQLGHINSQLRGYSAELKNGAVQARSTAGAFDFLGASLGKMATRLAEFYSLRAVLFTVSGQVSATVSTLLDLNQAVHDTLAITGASPKVFRDMEQAALSMAKNTKFSATEVAEGMKILAQAGVENKDLIPVTNVATMLATGSGATIDQATKVLTTGMNVWKIEAKDSISIANVMTGALNASKLEIGELGTAFNYLANQSALSGRTLTETTALIAMLRNQGIAASTIGTSMSQMLKTLESPTPRFGKLLANYKIDPEDIKPTKKSMVEIIQVFEEAAKKVGNNSIAIGDIFAGLESRVGRGFATLVQGGSEALRQMEDQIRNTNSAAVAWAESMKGARSQINILKAELTETVSELGKNFSAMVGAKDILRDLIVGFRDTGVQVVTLTVGLGGLTLALKGLALAHPATAAFVALGIAIAAVGAKIGNSNREIASDFDKLNNTIANNARDFKNSTEELNGLNRAIKENKRDINGKIIVSEQYRSILSTVIGKYPELKGHLGDEKLLQAKVTEELAKQNAERRESIRLQSGEYNKTAGKANKQVMEFRKDFTETYGADIPKGASPAEMETLLEAAIKKRGIVSGGILDNISNNISMRGKLGGIKESVGALNNTKTLMDGNVGYVGNKDATTGLTTSYTYDPSIVAAVDQVTKNTDKRQGGGGKTADEKREAAAIKKLTHDTAKWEALVEKTNNEIVVISSKADRSMDEQILKDKEKSTEDRTAAMVRIFDANMEQYTAEYESKITTLNTDFASTHKMEFNADLWAFTDPTSGKILSASEVKARTTEKHLEQLHAIQAGLKSAYLGSSSKLQAANEKALVALDTAPVDKAPSTARLAKEADFALRVTSQRLALEKEGVWTAQEREKIEVQMAEATLNNSEKKAVIYQAEIDFWNKKKVLNADEKAKLESAVDLHAETLELIKQQAAEVAKIQSMNPWSSFKDGARGAWSQQTDINAQSKQLGGNLTNTAINGVSDSIFSAMNPDKQKIAETKATINELNVKKSELEDSIASSSANTNRTAAETNSLNEKKIALNGINASLREQQDALKAQTNGWKTFADGMKKTMTMILEELQKYIIKMMVVAMVQRAIGLFASSTATTGAGDQLGGATAVPVGSTSSANGAFAATGGLITTSGVKYLADGGIVSPLSKMFVPKGTDTIPAMLSPGEIVMSRRAVLGIGEERLLRANKLAHLSEGGLVGGSSSSGGNKGNTEKPYEIHIYNIADPNSIPRQQADANEILNIISFSAAERGIMHKVIKGTMQA